MADLDNVLRQGLLATPKYLPVWYRYDRQGSVYNDLCLSDNTYYYLHRSEKSVIREQLTNILKEVEMPFTLVDLGSGNTEKTRIIIDAILETQTSLTYVPVDISEDFLLETSASLVETYGNRLNVQPVPGEYTIGFQKIRDMSGRKLVLWFGSIQCEPYYVQVNQLRQLSHLMAEDDRLLITCDVTQDNGAVEKAYLDPAGISAKLYLNAFTRLNNEYGSTIEMDSFTLERKTKWTKDDHGISGIKMRAVSKHEQTIHIPGLDLQFSLAKGEAIYLHHGEFVSCKYTTNQLRTIVRKGGLLVHRLWIDKDQHVALAILGNSKFES